MLEQKKRIQAFLSQYIRDTNLTDNTDIFAEGFVSSLFAMQLIVFLEDEFNLTIENDDLNLDNFRTINALAGLVARKHPELASV